MEIITEGFLIKKVGNYIEEHGPYAICAATGMAPSTVKEFGTKNHRLKEIKKMAGFFNVRVILIPTSE